MPRTTPAGVMLAFQVSALAVLLGACQNSRSPAPSQNVGATTEVTLRVGETTFVDNIEIRFGAVLEDSRCPEDVQCVWAGNAQVELGVGPPRGTQGPTQRMLLNTMEGAKSGEAWGLQVTLVELTPAPKSTPPIPPDSYVVRLKVEPAAE